MGLRVWCAYLFKPATTWDGSLASLPLVAEVRTSLECSLDSAEVSRSGLVSWGVLGRGDGLRR